MHDTVSVVSTVALYVPGMQVAALGMKYLNSDKNDGKAVEGVLEGIKDPKEREAVAAAYQKRTGEKLDTALDESVPGAERVVIEDRETGEGD